MSEFLYHLKVGETFLAETQNPEAIKKKKKKSNYIELLNGKQNKTKQKPTIIKSKGKWPTGKKICNLNAKGLSLKLKNKQTLLYTEEDGKDPKHNRKNVQNI